MTKRLYCIYFFLCLFLPLYSYAQVANLEFKSIGTKDGLSQSSIRCINQDQTGFMWFGTKDGLNKYDGYNFTSYKKSSQNKNSIGSNNIKNIINVKETLWITTSENILVRWNTNNETFINGSFNGIDNIQCTYADRAGNIWIAAISGLFKFDSSTKKIIRYTYSQDNHPSNISDNVYCITEDSDGNIWLGTWQMGIRVLNPKTNTVRLFRKNSSLKNSLSNNQIKFIFEDSKKNIWVGTYGGGLNLFRKETGDFIQYKHKNNEFKSATNQNFLFCMEEDDEGNLWVGTDIDGLYIFNPNKETFVTYLHSENDPKSIGSNSITCIKKDKAGNMWLGTTNSGLCVTKPGAHLFKHYKHSKGSNSLSYNIVNNFFEDSAKNIWIGTDGGGLNKFNEQSELFKAFKHKPNDSQSISGDYVLAIAEDNHRNIWVGTWANGITLITPDHQFKHFKNDPKVPGSLNNNNVFCIYKDSKGRIWVGTFGGGVNLYDEIKGAFKHFSYDGADTSSINSNQIFTIKEDRKGNLWVGTNMGGLNRFDEDQQKFISKPYQHLGLNKSITSIYEDSKDNLWLGTRFGLISFNPTTNESRTFFTENGLGNNIIGAVLEDKNGAIWVSTYTGISKISANNSIKNYTLDDGLQDNEFTSASLRSSSGRMYFGGINGFNSFIPENIKEQVDISPIVFTNFQIYNKNVPVAANDRDNSPLKQTISQTKNITIPYYYSVFSFEFAALNISTKEKKKYRYRLKGFDDNWHDLGNKNSLTFTNLDAGDYVLQVDGANGEGQWLRNISQIEITITPPFWKTWWFIALEFLLATGIIIFIFYYRLASIKNRNKELEQEVALRTHEISEANSFLMESNEEIQVQNVYLEEYNNEIQRKTEKIIEQQKHILVQNQNLEITVNELQGSNKTKDKLFSIIAHDLKNPVSALTGISELLTKNLPELEKEEIGEYAKHINNASHSIDKLINNLLDWSRTQSENLTYEPEEINVHEVVMKNVFLAEIQLKNKNINTDLDIDSTHLLYADKHMVDAVIRNLLSNAIKFTERNGNISLSSKEKDGQIEIKIEDTGIGMTEEQIYNVLHHLDHSISYGTSGETGTRLGLQIVKEFIEINKGTLSIESEKNKGTIFTISLPKHQGRVGEEQQQYISEEHTIGLDKINFSQDTINLLKGKTILIVDDDEEVRNFVKLLLAGIFEIFEAANGKEGLKVALDIQPDMIITDMMMPIMSGLEFCHQIKGDYNTSHIPVILITSNTGDQGQLASYKAGSDAFLTKPINHKILFQIILNLFKNQENAKKRFTGSDGLFSEDINYNKLDTEFIKKVQDYVEQHLSDTDLDYKKICELTIMSRTVLYSKFKALTGMGVHDFIKNIRLTKSVSLLQEGKLNISQIAYEVGFTTPSYFSKSFTKKYSIGPKEYIAKLKAGSSKKNN